MEQDESIDLSKKKKDKIKKKRADKLTGAMFRNLMSNHLQINALADSKAGLLVSINSIIISIVTSLIVHDVTSNPILLFPTTLLILTCLATIILALSVTQPRIAAQQTTASSDIIPKIDLLFFGDYTQMSKELYKEQMLTLIENDIELQEKMIENIYSIGKVIEKKYKRLKIAYSIFMIGFPISIISFLATYFVMAT